MLLFVLDPSPVSAEYFASPCLISYFCKISTSNTCMFNNENEIRATKTLNQKLEVPLKNKNPPKAPHSTKNMSVTKESI